MKKLALAFSLFAVLVSSASAAVFSFDSVSTGTFQALTPPPLVSVSITHPNVAVNLPFEFTSMAATQVVDFGATPPAGLGHFTFTAPGGDELRGDWNVIFLGTANPLEFVAPGSFTFTGGSGIFDGATGSGTLTALVHFADPTMTGGTSTVAWNGQIALVPEPTIMALGCVGLVLFAVRRSRQS
jgi:hypothetical protein